MIHGIVATLQAKIRGRVCVTDPRFAVQNQAKVCLDEWLSIPGKDPRQGMTLTLCGHPLTVCPTSALQAQTSVKSLSVADLVTSPNGLAASSTSTCTRSTRSTKDPRGTALMRWMMYSGCSKWYLNGVNCGVLMCGYLTLKPII